MEKFPLVLAALVLMHAGHSSAAIPTGRKILKNGLVPVLCNNFFPCPSGFTCMSNPIAPGTSACFSMVQGAGEKRPGRCPSADSVRASSVSCRGSSSCCMWHSDCPVGQRCCATSDGSTMAQCVSAIPVDDGTPIVTVIQPGLQTSGDDKPPVGEKGSAVSGTITLVQSKGKTVLFDTGASAAKIDLINGLAAQGLTLEDIDHVEISHGHPDHYGNIGMFEDTKGGVGQFDLNWYGKKSVFRFPKKSGGNVYGWTTANGEQQYFIFDDANMQMVKANGHTTQDATLVVRNAQGMGTVFIAGDIFMNKDDYSIKVGDQSLSDFAAEDPDQNPISRKWVACNADWIIPGHGPMFQPDDNMKQYFGC